MIIQLYIKTVWILIPACMILAAQPAPIALWPGNPPGAMGTDPDRDVPRIYPYLPAEGNATGSAMVICPGGGYSAISMDGEGYEPAQWFADKGIACFVLRYRLGVPDSYTYPQIIADGCRAMRLVRNRAREWGIDTARIGIMGFSAGGHIASTVAAGIYFGELGPPDSVDSLSCMPQFTVLVYPVISMETELTYTPGQYAFFGGPTPSPELIDSFSNEKHVTGATPPAFITIDVSDFMYAAAQMYYDSCIAHGVSAEMKPLQGCGHGFGMGCGEWSDAAFAWLLTRGFLSATHVAFHVNEKKSTYQARVPAKGLFLTSTVPLRARFASGNILIMPPGGCSIYTIRGERLIQPRIH